MLNRLLSIILLLGFISGCTTGMSVIENTAYNVTNETNQTPLVQKVKIVPMEKEEDAKSKKEQLILTEKQRRFKAIGFDIFDFDDLTFENCDRKKIEFTDKILELRDDVDEAEKTLKEEERDVKIANKELQDAINQGLRESIIDNKREDLDEQEKDVEESENRLEDVKELLKKHKVILKEMEKECKEISASK